jgi:hypothetical protein
MNFCKKIFFILQIIAISLLPYFHFQIALSNSTIGSLEQKLKSVNEKHSIEIMLELTKLYYQTDLGKSMDYAKQTYELSEKYSDYEVMG